MSTDVVVVGLRGGRHGGGGCSGEQGLRVTVLERVDESERAATRAIQRLDANEQ